MPVNGVIGLQRGDEGKGRFVDMLAEEHDIVARFNGGNNAGHTVVLPDGRELALHLVPSGIAHEHTMNVIGNGTLINANKLVDEIDDIRGKGLDVSRHNLKISSAAHLILPHHIYDDQIREAGTGAQGSTKSGIAQVASFKAMRTGVRAEIIKNDPQGLLEIIRAALAAQRELRAGAGIDPIDEADEAARYVSNASRLGQYVTDTVFFLNRELGREWPDAPPARVLAEGAQATWLDIDHGMYPFTTSSSTTSGGIATGLGIPPQFIANVTGIAKAVQSHVGGGPFVTEIKDQAMLERLHGDMTTIDAEKGTTTGRVRRLGHLDLPQIRRSLMINGARDMALSKLDWVPRYGEKVLMCVAYQRKGKTLEVAPDAAYKLEQCEPIYGELPTWQEDIREARNFHDLPANAQLFIEFLEAQLKTTISMIGVGPGREQVIDRRQAIA